MQSLPLFALLILAFNITACGSVPDYLEPSGQALRPPADDMSFSEYVSTNKQAILSVLKSKHPNNFQGDYTLEEAAELRAPFEWPIASDSQCASGIGGADKGFLLIHGLTSLKRFNSLSIVRT